MKPKTLDLQPRTRALTDEESGESLKSDENGRLCTRFATSPHPLLDRVHSRDRRGSKTSSAERRFGITERFAGW